jgi:FMN phosphatase YigB (HAD superfamily)
MSLNEMVIEGTIQPDGSLELDQKPNLRPGRVTVVLRQVSETLLPKDDPFWQRMQAMWAIPKAAGTASDGGANSLVELHKMREEWDEHQQDIERLQDECRAARKSPEERKP